MTNTYTMYGGPVSLYSGKVRSYLRKQGIDFVEQSPGSDRYLNHIVPTVGRWIVPCVEAPDGTIIQDGADIIDHFEKGPGSDLRRFSSYPQSPVLLAISHLFELFGGEGLLRPAMHYRWNFDEENLDFLTAEFALMMPASMAGEKADEAFLHNSGRMRKAAGTFGVSASNGPLIEEAFEEWLDLFSAHLLNHPYLLGGHPTIGDFGLIAAMWAHLFRDPAPASLIKKRAPRVGRWVERMATSEAYLHEYDGAELDLSKAELINDQELPETLLAMMAFVAEEYLPEISAHVDVANEWLSDNPDLEAGTNGLENPAHRGLMEGGGGYATFEWRGQSLTTGVMPYRFWLMQRLHDDLALADSDAQDHIRAIFREANLEPMLDLRTLRRVERTGHLEVWGPLVTE